MLFQRQIPRFFISGSVIVFLFIWAIGSTYAGDVVFIVNNGVTSDTATKKDLRSMFLGAKSVWPDNQKVNIATLINPEVHKIFVKDYTRKSVSQFQAWWRKRLFTGIDKIPPKFNSDQEMIDFVSKTGGGLGYISGNVSTGDKVKILTVISE